jgi:hypothetical protein
MTISTLHRNTYSPLRHREHGDVIFFVCRETAANEKHPPYRARAVGIHSVGSIYPAGYGVFAHGCLPMGKKGNTLWALRGSVVNKSYVDPSP